MDGQRLGGAHEALVQSGDQFAIRDHVAGFGQFQTEVLGHEPRDLGGPHETEDDEQLTEGTAVLLLFLERDLELALREQALTNQDLSEPLAGFR